MTNLKKRRFPPPRIALDRFWAQASQNSGHITSKRSAHAYEVRPRKDHRGVDLISDALPFGRLRNADPNLSQCNRIRANITAGRMMP